MLDAPLYQTLELPFPADDCAEAGSVPSVAEAIDLLSYDTYIQTFSGGKDSLACLVALLDAGVPRERIELWHHDVDGREGEALMDWPVTEDYCRKIAEAFGVPIYFSWRQGGIEREMLRENARTAPVMFETPDGLRQGGGVNGPLDTRLRFPQVAADLSVRWCSAVAKIDVCALALRNQERFNGRRTLVITGERAQESANRARYQIFEPHKADGRRGRARRHMDHWRPVHGWSEAQVWEAIERYRINPHPAYHLGWSRVSCMNCIFGDADQWATIGHIAPQRLQRVGEYEQRFGVTIQRKHNVFALAAAGKPYPAATLDRAKVALSKEFTEPVFLEHWTLPAGAFAKGCGPT